MHPAKENSCAVIVNTVDKRETNMTREDVDRVRHFYSNQLLAYRRIKELCALERSQATKRRAIKCFSDFKNWLPFQRELPSTEFKVRCVNPSCSKYSKAIMENAVTER